MGGQLSVKSVVQDNHWYRNAESLWVCISALKAGFRWGRVFHRWQHLLVATILYSSHSLPVVATCSSNFPPHLYTFLLSFPRVIFIGFLITCVPICIRRSWFWCDFQLLFADCTANLYWGQQPPKATSIPGEGAPLVHREQARHSLTQHTGSFFHFVPSILSLFSILLLLLKSSSFFPLSFLPLFTPSPCWVTFLTPSGIVFSKHQSKRQYCAKKALVSYQC